MPPTDVVNFRLDNLESRCDGLHDKITKTDEIVTQTRLDVRGIQTTVRFWGSLVVILTPILASLGAWIVLSAAASRPATAATSAATAKP